MRAARSQRESGSGRTTGREGGQAIDAEESTFRLPGAAPRAEDAPASVRGGGGFGHPEHGSRVQKRVVTVARKARGEPGVMLVLLWAVAA